MTLNVASEAEPIAIPGRRSRRQPGRALCVHAHPRTVWEALLAAAEEMNIGPDDETHGGSRRKIDDRLAAGAESFELQALLNDWDPIGVYDPATNFPDNEYDCLYEPLLARLRRGEDGATIGAFLETELRDHFGLDPQWSRPYDFAVRLVNWFAGRS